MDFSNLPFFVVLRAEALKNGWFWRVWEIFLPCFGVFRCGGMETCHNFGPSKRCVVPMLCKNFCPKKILTAEPWKKKVPKTNREWSRRTAMLGPLRSKRRVAAMPYLNFGAPCEAIAPAPWNFHPRFAVSAWHVWLVRVGATFETHVHKTWHVNKACDVA